MTRKNYWVSLACLVCLFALSACSQVSQNAQGNAEIISDQDRQEIRDLISYYAHTFDNNDAEAWVALFTEDAELIEATNANAKGTDELRQWALSRMQQHTNGGEYRLSHSTVNVVLLPVSKDVVRTRSYCILGRQSVTKMEPGKVLAIGIYEDEMRRTDNGWKFSRRHADTALSFDLDYLPGSNK